MTKAEDIIVLRYGDKGPAVGYVQRVLVRLGAPIVVDGIWGPRTEDAARKYLGANRNTAITLGALKQLAGYDRPTAEELRDFLVHLASRFIGTRETRRNRSEWIDLFVRATGLDPAGEHPWCAAFCVWLLEQIKLAFSIHRTWTRSARVADHIMYARAHDRLLSAPERAALALRAPPRSHMAIVVGAADDIVVTIEGNTNASGSREGDGVYRRVRSRSYWSSYYHPIVGAGGAV